MRAEQRCYKCGGDYLFLIDTVEINGNEVQFLACFRCQVGYTKHENEMERIY